MSALVVNFFGGPGCGKSTLATKIFYELKTKGINTEYVSEFAKDLVWEENKVSLNNQIYVFGVQHQRINRLLEKVDIIVVDSPLLLSIIYDKTNNDSLYDLVRSEFSGFNNINFFIKRDANDFVEVGRIHNKGESEEIDEYIIDLLEEEQVEYIKINKKQHKKVLKIILKEIKNNARPI